ncbi:Vacuolar protein sorting-associated protein 18 [Neolecta irregularis DAH-3]|uniref:Vacuolar protein sorting-associated protein 18 n=1 Tax=Neolecta irregularis (strain DAH-3) TaxID=1198029 RepID=A0A1U7LG54_NEOID|nr:Vacuolar protein sorting-associated protein 18 [Neolecta irregularis DAH-3]|eukprot:OLL21635.1 Vacuolar protein sorting-associated protein 18 [Neolecta irregularis DAH-3]
MAALPLDHEQAYIEDAAQGLVVEQPDIFSISRVQLQFAVSITAMTVSNNILIMALASGRLLRLDLANPQDIDDLEITRKPGDDTPISRLFQDATGHHLIISTDPGDNFYINSRWTKGKPLSRLKGSNIRSIAWNKQATANSTKEILIGLDNGTIFETYIETADEYFKRDERYLKQLYRDPANNSIVGLHSDSIGGQISHRFVLIATPAKIAFISGNVARTSSDIAPIYPKLFEQLHVQKSNFQEFSQARSDSHLSISPDLHSIGPSTAASCSFAWAAGAGIFHGELKTLDISTLNSDLVFSDAKIIPYSTLFEQSNDPLLIAASKYHILILRNDVVTAINRLNDSIIYQDKVPKLPGEKIIGFVADTVQSTYWIYSAESIYEVVVSNEDRDIWKIFLHRKAFDSAFKLAKADSQKDIILIAEANDMIAKQSYAQAATIYAQTTKPFDEVTLSLLQYNQRDALSLYLVKKLSNLKRDLLMQRTMIATWVLEIYLTKMNELDDAMSNEGKLQTDKVNLERERTNICVEFKEFITNHRKDLDIQATYDLINSFARPHEMLVFANIVQDYDYLLSYLVRKQDWQEALAILNKQSEVEIFYKYAMILLIKSPKESVDIWMRQNDIDPRRLIPALLRYNEHIGGSLENNQAIRYLNFAITELRINDSSVHNTLISIYARNPSGDEDALLCYLQSQTQPFYDLDFALRLCSQFDHVRSCVHVYSSMSLFERGVDMALKYDDVELAIQVAEQVEDDDNTRKKLWLRIAQKVVSGSDGIKTAIQFLKRCSLLKIEDLVPFFPDFVVIDDFKEEICAALEDYSSHIDQLRREMDDSVRSAEHIQTDITELSKRYTIIQAGERCFHCQYPLLSRQFYVFPCQHTFHADCLIARVSKGVATSVQRKRIAELNLEISQMTGIEGKRTQEHLEELEHLIAAECVLCGSMAIKSVDEPFIGTSVGEREAAASWVFD